MLYEVITVLNDVIAAISTAPGRAAVALVRVSGREAHTVARRILDPFRADDLRRVRRARVRHPDSGEILDDVV